MLLITLRVEILRGGSGADQLRVTVIERQLVLPAASAALMTMVVAPMYSGMDGVVQLFVPVAVPAVPFELAHVTETTPTLSVAVPLTTKELEVVV